jgi:hypothetical protein
VSCNATTQYCNVGNGGYGFAYYDGQGTPPGDSTATLQIASGLCISGTVGQVVNAMYSTDWGCGIGVNVNQAMGANPPANGLLLTGTGITVSTSAIPSCTTARVVIDDNGTSYCAALTPGVEIPWTTFNTTCYAPAMGTYLSGPPTAAAVKVQFVSTTTASCPFTNFCITQISL